MITLSKCIWYSKFGSSPVAEFCLDAAHGCKPFFSKQLAYLLFFKELLVACGLSYAVAFA